MTERDIDAMLRIVREDIVGEQKEEPSAAAKEALLNLVGGALKNLARIADALESLQGLTKIL